MSCTVRSGDLRCRLPGGHAGGHDALDARRARSIEVGHRDGSWRWRALDGARVIGEGVVDSEAEAWDDAREALP